MEVGPRRAVDDPGLAELRHEVTSYPTVRALGTRPARPQAPVVVPVQLRHPEGTLSFITTIATFGTPTDVTVSELAIETFLPADDQTASRITQSATTS